MYLIDTNVFLEVLLRQKRYIEAKRLLKGVQTGNFKGYVSKFSLYSIEILFTSLKKFSELKKFLAALALFKGLEILSTTIFDEILISGIAKEKKLDYDDALQFYLVKKYNLKGIISFDHDFDKVDINRFEPKDLLTK